MIKLQVASYKRDDEETERAPLVCVAIWRGLRRNRGRRGRRNHGQTAQQVYTKQEARLKQTMPLSCHLLLLSLVLLRAAGLSSVPQAAPSKPDHRFLILGGTGRIGTAVASHLLQRSPSSSAVLAGRDERRGSEAVKEVLAELTALGGGRAAVSFNRLDWRDDGALRSLLETSGCTCLIHTAGPFLDEEPSPLRAAIDAPECRAYLDVSDPLDFLDKSLAMDADAKESGTSALLAAGAFPGMSNVFAMEAARRCLEDSEDGARIQDARFNYFTAGLGGSGDVNLASLLTCMFLRC